MEQDSHLLTGEQFIVVDKRDRQAVLRAILELEQALSPAERGVLRDNRQTLVKAVLGLEKEYARFDTVLEDRRLFQAKDALYAEVLPAGTMNRLLTEAQFTQWQNE